MAQKTVVQLVDDLDGSPLADGEGKTITLTFEGVSYEIDLSSHHVDELKAALSPYLAAARKTSGRRSSSRSGNSKTDPAELQKIRDWAAENGHTVSNRGRISAAVRDAYDSAH